MLCISVLITVKHTVVGGAEPRIAWVVQTSICEQIVPLISHTHWEVCIKMAAKQIDKQQNILVRLFNPKHCFALQRCSFYFFLLIVFKPGKVTNWFFRPFIWHSVFYVQLDGVILPYINLSLCGVFYELWLWRLQKSPLPFSGTRSVGKTSITSAAEVGARGQIKISMLSVLKLS